MIKSRNKIIIMLLVISIITGLVFLINYLLCINCKNGNNCLFGNCKCKPGWKGANCDKLNCVNGTLESNLCKCNKFWTGKLCDKLNCEGLGNYVPNKNKSGCVCNSYFQGENCNFSKACTTEPKCSGNGYCTNINNVSHCICNSGFTGYDCSKKTTFEGCKTDPPCNGHGQCSNDGKFCICNHEWIGDQCQDPTI